MSAATASGPLIEEFRRTLQDCRQLYRDCAQDCLRYYAQSLQETPDAFLSRMYDLHRALLVKVFVAIVRADWHWSPAEQVLTGELVEHLWAERLEGDRLRQAVEFLVSQESNLRWWSIVRPFAEYPVFRDRQADLNAAVMRLGNIVAKIDGEFHPHELRVLSAIQSELDTHLKPIPLADGDSDAGGGSQRGSGAHQSSIARQSSTARQFSSGSATARNAPPSSQAQPPGLFKSGIDRGALPASPGKTPTSGSSAAGAASAGPTASGGTPTSSGGTRGNATGGGQANMAPGQPLPVKTPEEALQEALADLDALIGLPGVKEDVRGLTNFLRMQEQRRSMGLPTTQVGLHMVFAGNPGTGKTSVARILARVYGAMGILQKGHLVETDRSGLVAEYAGQTGPKTHRKIDEALDGVLFIDEAYSLVSMRGDDAFGAEAVQTLLKRMEDDRARLIVILAGYPQEMRELLESNPGLSSRFNRHLTFQDYSAEELGRIFHKMCESNHYTLPAATRAKLLLGFQHLLEQRDEHFGNGRLARNIFEMAIRRLANRIAFMTPVTREMLTTLEPEDVRLEGVPEGALSPQALAESVFRTACPQCQKSARLRGRLLGAAVRCAACKANFTIDWAAPPQTTADVKEDEVEAEAN